MSEKNEEPQTEVVAEQCLADGSNQATEADADADAEADVSLPPDALSDALDAVTVAGREVQEQPDAISAKEQEDIVIAEKAPVALKELPVQLDPGALARVSPQALYQPFWARIEQLVTACAARGVQYFVVCGIRTFEEQGELFAQGRTKPGKVVTRARPGQSAHQYGVAVDFSHDSKVDVRGLQPDWVLENYKVLAEEAAKLGLDAGFNWAFQDAPHVQLHLDRHGIELSQLEALYHGGGMKACWHLLDRYTW